MSLPIDGDSENEKNNKEDFGIFGKIKFLKDEFNTIQKNLEMPLGPEFISKRPGPGNQQISYLEGFRAFNIANDIFGFNGWSTNIRNISIDYTENSGDKFQLGVSALVRITLKDGTFREDLGFGHGECAITKSKQQAYDSAKKSAVTDAIKRALRQFGNGAGNCVYDKRYIKQLSKIKFDPITYESQNIYRSSENIGKISNPAPINTTKPPNPPPTNIPKNQPPVQVNTAICPPLAPTSAIESTVQLDDASAEFCEDIEYDLVDYDMLDPEVYTFTEETPMPENTFEKPNSKLATSDSKQLNHQQPKPSENISSKVHNSSNINHAQKEKPSSSASVPQPQPQMNHRNGTQGNSSAIMVGTGQPAQPQQLQNIQPSKPSKPSSSEVLNSFKNTNYQQQTNATNQPLHKPNFPAPNQLANQRVNRPISTVNGMVSNSHSLQSGSKGMGTENHGTKRQIDNSNPKSNNGMEQSTDEVNAKKVRA